MERLGKSLAKIMPRDFVTLRECVIASYEANGPMSENELFQSLPLFKKVRVREVAALLPDEVTGR